MGVAGELDSGEGGAGASGTGQTFFRTFGRTYGRTDGNFPFIALLAAKILGTIDSKMTRPMNTNT